MQQVYDYIAVYSCMEIFEGRMVDQQMSSIQGRGQIKGIQLIQKYIIDDNIAINYAKNNFLDYVSKCQLFVKLDIQKCYPSADLEIFINLLKHDCGNETIIWLWITLLSSHHVNNYKGFMIGALPSQWGVQMMLSFIYRYAMNLKNDKGKQIINHIVMFMDDMTLFGSNKEELFQAIYKIINYSKEFLNFIIKPTFMINELKGKVGVDMMGYVIYRNGKIEMRSRNYIRSRRLIDKFHRNKKLNFQQARRLNSFKGCYKYSNCHQLKKDLNIKFVFYYSGKVISQHDKKENLKNGKSNIHGRARGNFIYAAS